ncbi:MAG: aryl-sulfate sulfotransferase [Eubacterium sp.]|nr:aryl-sulfate sulfotransferase [Eubacterium sp.]
MGKKIIKILFCMLFLTVASNAKAEVKTVKHSTKNVYTTKYQREATKQLKKWKKTSRTINKPLLVKNPYGTMSTSIYYYAVSKKPYYVKCTVAASGAETVTMTFAGGKAVTKHEFLITGLVAGKTNKVTLQFYDKQNVLKTEKKYSIKMKKDKVIPKIKKVKKGSSKVAVSSGFYAVFGHDKSTATNIYYYDNKGVNRGRTPLNGYRTDRILTVNGKWVFSYDINKIAIMDRLGHVVRQITLKGYELHHDFMYDSKHKKLLCLVNDLKKNTIEDVVISVDIKTKKIKKLIDFSSLLKDARKKHVQRKGGKNTYGGTELDWLHLNSLDLIRDGELIVSSREESSLIKVDNIYSKPKIDYLIHSGTFYNNTKYKKYLLKRVGPSFVGHAGQHTITVEKSADLPENQYYLYLYNNNFGSAKTLPNFNWKKYKGVGTYRKGSASYYYKYLVDETKKTYELVKKFAVPYSSVVSGVQHYKGNITFSSGMDHTYGEYDSDGKMIRIFEYAATRYAYRVMKYDFGMFCA